MMIISEFYSKFQRYVNNASWMMLEKLVSMGLAFLVTVFLARYFGPEDFGVLAYAMSLTTMFAVAGHMGLSGLVVKEMVEDRANNEEIVATTFVLKIVGLSIGFILLYVLVFFVKDNNEDYFLPIMVISLSMFFISSEVYEYWFQSHVMARYTSIARILSSVLGAGLKVSGCALGFGIVYIAYSHFLQAMAFAITLACLYKMKAGFKILPMDFSISRAKRLLSKGWLVYLGTIFSLIYLKIDQVMLEWVHGTAAVGVYSVASTLSEAWYFIPVAIVASYFPRLISLRSESPRMYKDRLQKILNILFSLSLFVAVAVTIFSSSIIDAFFGERYEESAFILSIHIWAGVFIFMRAALSRWILIENKLVFSTITQGCGAITNVVLNYYLIPSYGGAGAALATLISYACASYFALLITRETREMFYMMSKSMFSPFIYFLAFLSKMLPMK